MKILERLGLIKSVPAMVQMIATPEQSQQAINMIMERSKDAFDHYCHICKIGFKTRGGKKNHMRLKYHG